MSISLSRPISERNQGKTSRQDPGGSQQNYDEILDTFLTPFRTRSRLMLGGLMLGGGDVGARMKVLVPLTSRISSNAEHTGLFSKGMDIKPVLPPHELGIRMISTLVICVSARPGHIKFPQTKLGMVSNLKDPYSWQLP